MAVATQYATGRRKCAIARAWVTGRAGDITINDQPIEKVFPRLTLRQIIQFPLEIGGVVGQYSIKATVHGGGPTGTSRCLASCDYTRVGGTQSAPSNAFEEGRLADTGLSCQRTEKVRAEGCEKTVPVLKAINSGATVRKREGSRPSLFLCRWVHRG